MNTTTTGSRTTSTPSTPSAPQSPAEDEVARQLAQRPCLKCATNTCSTTERGWCHYCEALAERAKQAAEPTADGAAAVATITGLNDVLRSQLAGVPRPRAGVVACGVGEDGAQVVWDLSAEGSIGHDLVIGFPGAGGACRTGRQFAKAAGPREALTSSAAGAAPRPEGSSS